MTPVLETKALYAGYQKDAVVRDLNIHVDAGEIVALLGSNGAGKTTSLLTIAGLLRPISGVIRINGDECTKQFYRRVRDGLGLVTEERAVLTRLTVAENLRVGRCRVDQTIEFFPELEPLMDRTVGLLSGGQQQMLALARSMARPGSRMLLVDELSMGLAPVIVQRLLAALRRAADNGLAVLMVEQHVHLALNAADRAYVMRRGRIEMAGKTSQLRQQLGDLKASYI
jgi:branched-chain amino acid transport system ATP-binding protein